MSTPDFSDILLAVQSIQLGVKRVEEKIDALETKTDNSMNKFDRELENHEEWLRKHEVDIRLIESRIGPRVSVISWIAGLAAATAIFLAVMDRIYGI